MAIIIFLFVLIAEIMAAVEFNSIANDKGYPGSKYGWWCALFPFAGYLMVVALPDRNGVPAAPAPAAKVPVESDELPEL